VGLFESFHNTIRNYRQTYADQPKDDGTTPSHDDGRPHQRLGRPEPSTHVVTTAWHGTGITGNDQHTPTTTTLTALAGTPATDSIKCGKHFMQSLVAQLHALHHAGMTAVAPCFRGMPICCSSHAFTKLVTDDTWHVAVLCLGKPTEVRVITSTGPKAIPPTKRATRKSPDYVWRHDALSGMPLYFCTAGAGVVLDGLGSPWHWHEEHTVDCVITDRRPCYRVCVLDERYWV